jgi:hypothetical protein
MSERTIAPGLILIGLGVVLFLIQVTGVGAEAVVAVIGAVFLIAYATTRQYGFMIPGGILTGLGLGILWETEIGSGGGAVLIGLGLGFISIFLIGALVHDRATMWWPIIPGGILTAIGALVETENQGMVSGVGELWPIVLVVIGGLLILVQLTRPASTHREEPPPAN